MSVQKITPCLWFDGRAEQAAEFYKGVFKKVEVLKVTHYCEEGREIHGQEPGSAMTVEFEIDGQKFLGLNGGPLFKFSEAVSFMIDCKTQGEVDHYWTRLTAEGGEESQCGWLKDKFGLSWQVVPEALPRMMNDPDTEKAERVMAAVMTMKKIDIAKLEAAYAGAA